MSWTSAQLARASWLSLATKCPFWCAAFLASLLLPTEFSIYAGELRLSPYRIVLLIAFFPTAISLISGRCGRIVLPDILITAFAIWNMIVLGYHHGPEVMLQSGGVQSLELMGAYLIARTTLRRTEQFAGMIVVLCGVIAVILPFALYETITGHRIIKETVSGGSFSSRIEPRYGFTRAFGPFDHPILWGVFAASALGMAWGLARLRRSIAGASLSIMVVLAAASSVSSGAIVSLWTQFFAIGYERCSRGIAKRWTLFWIALLAMYAILEIASNRPAIIAITTRLSLSSGTAYGRSIIFRYGMENVWASPIMGIGFNDWTRPAWLHDSVDNFWLLTAMVYGIPGFALFSAAVLAVLLSNWRNCRDANRVLRTGWCISMAGMIVACATVHLWNNAYVYFAFLIGCGSVFCGDIITRAGVGVSRHSKARLASRGGAR